MAAIFLTKRTIINVSKRSSSSSRFSRACLSTAYNERAEGRNAVTETGGVGDSGTSARAAGVANDPVREGMYEAKQQGFDMTNNPVKENAVKAAKWADTVGEIAKQKLDGAWKAANETTKKIKDAVRGDEDEAEGPNSRSVPDDSSIEDLRRRAGGYDKKDH